MTYAETISFLYSQLPQFQRVGAEAYKPGLDNVRLLDAWCGHPHLKYPCIHVAGTNGKGSVSHLLASVLAESGYKVGLFTSPHLKDFRERIRVNGRMIPEAYVTRFVQTYREAASLPPFCRIDGGEVFQPSFFELTCAMAFSWFAAERVDVAVVEVGLGGRLDSTNIIRPVLSVITSISFDHTNLLGDTLEKIAFEKAGIIKEDIPVVVARNPETVYEVFRQKAGEEHAPLVLADQTYRVTGNPAPQGQHLKVTRYDNGETVFESLPCALGGWYIQENAAGVLAALDILKERFEEIRPDSLRRGFASVVESTGLRGRWEIIGRNPMVVCDTGHNPAGIAMVAGQLKATPHRRLHIVFGVVNDKDARHMLELLPVEASYYFTKASVPRALDEHQLAELAAGFGLKGGEYATVAEALAAAKSRAAEDDLVYVGGSNFVVAEILP